MSSLRWSPAVALIACTWSATAHAGQPTAAELEAQAQAHREAGEAHREGREDGDPDGFAKCAAAYLDALALGTDRDDEVLWNAAACSYEAAQVGQAMQCWRAIVDSHPRSDLAGPALLRLADTAGSIAAYTDAADDYERFATLFPRDPEAGDALHNAYLFRVGLGQRDAALADLDAYEKLYRARDPERAAALFWSRRDLLESRKQQREHALEYLRVHGKSGGIDRMIVAEATIAQIDWRQSCRTPMVLDACIAIERTPKRPVHPNLARMLASRDTPQEQGGERDDDARSSYRAPKRCGDASDAIYTALRRDAKLAKAAGARFSTVLQLVTKGNIEVPPEQPARASALADAWGMALVYTADAELEQLIGNELPADLDFTLDEWRKHSGVAKWEKLYLDQIRTREASKKRLLDFYEQQLALGTRLLHAYAEVRGTRSRSWSLVAAARSAMVYQAVAGQLRRARVPSGLDRELEVATYCDTLADYAEPVSARIVETLVYCVESSTEYQHFDEASRWCEAELGLIDVARYPRTDELFGESSYAPTGLRSFGVQADPDALPESATSRPRPDYSAAEGSR